MLIIEYTHVLIQVGLTDGFGQNAVLPRRSRGASGGHVVATAERVSSLERTAPQHVRCVTSRAVTWRRRSSRVRPVEAWTGVGQVRSVDAGDGSRSDCRFLISTIMRTNSEVLKPASDSAAIPTAALRLLLVASAPTPMAVPAWKA